MATGETLGQRLFDLAGGQWDIPALHHLLEELIPQNSTVEGYELRHTFPTLGARVLLLNIRQIVQPSDDTALLLLAIEDVTERRRMEESLREHTEQFRILVESALDYAIFLLDEDNTIRSWNAGAERIIGYHEDEVLGKSLSLIFTPEDRAADIPTREIATARAVGRADDKRWHLKKDGTRFFADGVMIRLTGDDGVPRGFAKMLRDATVRLRYEESLREAEERLRFANEAANVGTWDFHPQTGELSWDERYRTLVGLPPDAPVNYEVFLSGIHPDDRANADAVVREAIRPGGSGACDFEYRVGANAGDENDDSDGGSSGNIRWIHSQGRAFRDAAGNTVRFIGTIRDVTRQKELEARVADEARKNARIAETLQKSLLFAPPPDTFPGISVKTFYESAWDDALIGGDFFDVFAVSENVVGVVVGDVTGKGLEAATYTAEAKFVLRGFLRETGDVSDAIGRLNRFIADAERLDAAHLGSAYIALSLACINTRTGVLTCVTAGAEPPFLLRADTGETEMVPVGGPMLGALPSAVFEAHEFVLRPGDVYAATTDGLTEARRAKEFWGLEGVIESVRDSVFVRNHPLARVAEEAARRAKEFAGGRQQDDVCLLLVRRL